MSYPLAHKKSSVSPLMPNSTASTLLPITPGGLVMKMTPLTQLQVAIKNNMDVFYFSVNMPTHVLFSEDGTIGKIRLSLLSFPLCSSFSSSPSPFLSSFPSFFSPFLSFPFSYLSPPFLLFLFLPLHLLDPHLPPTPTNYCTILYILSQIVRCSWQRGRRRYLRAMKYSHLLTMSLLRM